VIDASGQCSPTFTYERDHLYDCPHRNNGHLNTIHSPLLSTTANALVVCEYTDGCQTDWDQKSSSGVSTRDGFKQKQLTNLYTSDLGIRRNCSFRYICVVVHVQVLVECKSQQLVECIRTSTRSDPDTRPTMYQVSRNVFHCKSDRSLVCGLKSLRSCVASQAR
jgi:hypothetical protein